MTGSKNHIRVRIPPSPTGYCHVGTARMAVINYL
ncbi:MAG: glutamate--tRNA ligase family protein, partial [bacterium]|nr:glutamate--tRNA ligase family protein [bacterium]